MTTKYLTAIGVLILAIAFGFIFVNQFSNQPQTSNVANQNQTPLPPPPPAATPKAPDNVDMIEKDLNSVDVNGIDSDSAQFSSQLQGF